MSYINVVIENIDKNATELSICCPMVLKMLSYKILQFVIDCFVYVDRQYLGVKQYVRSPLSLSFAVHAHHPDRQGLIG